jgi:hypothetical protein
MAGRVDSSLPAAVAVVLSRQALRALAAERESEAVLENWTVVEMVEPLALVLGQLLAKDQFEVVAVVVVAAPMGQDGLVVPPRRGLVAVVVVEKLAVVVLAELPMKPVLVVLVVETPLAGRLEMHPVAVVVAQRTEPPPALAR